MVPTLKTKTTGFALVLVAVLFQSLYGEEQGQPPLHVRIDKLLAGDGSAPDRPAAPIVDDAGFLRRAYLDLAGTIPSSDEARAFLDDPSPEKRRQLIERLLSSPQYAQHMQQFLDVLLVERRGNNHIISGRVWRNYLRESFQQNKPWDVLVREIIVADGNDEDRWPSARFMIARDLVDADIVTQDIARLFLGRDLSCAQCHDDPFVEAYRQEDYYGLYAFVKPSFRSSITVRNGGEEEKRTIVDEKPEAPDVEFFSVFTDESGTTAPRLLGMDPTGSEEGESLGARERLANELTRAKNIWFRRNAVNRFWALMMGRGLVHPLDSLGANPPSHPELLDLLADEFAAMQFDIKVFLRELALTTTYQRSSKLPSGTNDVRPETFAVMALKPLSPEQLGNAVKQAIGKVRSDLGRQYVRTFKRPAGVGKGAFGASVDQALFIHNDDILLSYLRPRRGNIVQRLQKITEPRALAEELYLTVLSRRPSALEVDEVADYLNGRGEERNSALQELVWALLASAEFRFNH